LAKKLLPPAWLTRALARVLITYVKLCSRTIRWQGVGTADLAADLATGPVVFVVWHSRLVYAAAHWPTEAGLLGTIHDPSPAGSAAAALLESFGAKPLPMTKKASDVAMLRTAIKALRDGTSIGLAADGPTGPARRAKAAPIDWARISDRPVWLYAFSVKPALRLRTWDQMMLPLPFARGHFEFRKWREKLDRHADTATLARARDHLTEALNTLHTDVDQRAGHRADPSG